MFASADSDGLISFWQLSKGTGITTSKKGVSSPYSTYWKEAVSAESKLQNISKCYKVKPRLLFSFDFAAEIIALPTRMEKAEDDRALEKTCIGSEHPSIANKDRDERIVHMQFMPNDDRYLQVSTTRRLVLLSLHYIPCIADDEEKDGIEFCDADTEDGFYPTQVYGWTELDSIGHSHRMGRFSFFYSNNSGCSSSRDRIRESVNRDESYDNGRPLYTASGLSEETAGILWKVVEDNSLRNKLLSTPLRSGNKPNFNSFPAFAPSNEDESTLSTCRVSRQVWTNAMFQDALNRMKRVYM